MIGAGAGWKQQGNGPSAGGSILKSRSRSEPVARRSPQPMTPSSQTGSNYIYELPPEQLHFGADGSSSGRGGGSDSFYGGPRRGGGGRNSPQGRRGRSNSPMLGMGGVPPQTAFTAYHNFHANGGQQVIQNALTANIGGLSEKEQRSLGVERADRQRVLEEDFYPMRQRGKVQHMIGEIRDPHHYNGNNAASSYMQGVSDDGNGGAMFGHNGPSSYTYTGGFASSVFSTTNAEELTEEERREVYRQRHRQAYSALASVKPFLQRIFEDEEGADRGDEQHLQAMALAKQQKQQLQGGDPSMLLSSSAADGLGVGGMEASLGGGGAAAAGLGSTTAVTSSSKSKAMYAGGGGSGTNRLYAKQQASTAVNTLPSWNYEDLVRREAAKPLIMQTVVTTDRCPLTTKTCPPTYTAFNTFNYTVEAKDSEAFSYFAQVAATGSAAASQTKHRARMMGGGSTSTAARMNQNFAFTADKGNAEEPTVVNKTLQCGTLNVGMRVFRDFLLPETAPGAVGSAMGKGTHNQLYDEKALLREAHLAHLKRVIHSTKKVSERNHIAPVIDYDRW